MKKYVILSLFFLFAIDAIIAQTPHFGDDKILSVSIGYLSTLNPNTQTYNSNGFLNTSFMVSINQHFYGGIFYHRFLTSDAFTGINQLFNRGGFVCRYREPILNGSAAFNFDGTLAYSDFSVDKTGDFDFIKDSNFQIGINCLMDVKVYKSIYLSAGFSCHRTLRRGDYGLEVFPTFGCYFKF